MTIGELSGLTGISPNEIEGYTRDGLIGREVNGEISFAGDDAKRIGLIRKLEQFGLSERDIARFLALCDGGETQNAVLLLRDLRERMTRDIHDRLKALDVLDCIIYETKNKSGGAL